MDYEMDYETVKNKIFATGIVPNGYSGEKKKVGFSLVNGRCFAVHDHGYYDVGIPLAADEHEATWLLRRHPTARNFKNIKKKEEKK